MTDTTTSELDGLMHQAQAADQGAVAADLPPGAETEEQQPQGPDYATEAAGAVDMFAALVCGYAPAASSIWTEQKKGQVAMALAPVMEKYNFTLGAMPPEIVLAIMAGPPLVATIRVMAKQRAEQAKEQQPAQEAQPAAQPPAPGEPEGPGVHSQVALFKK